MFNYQFAKSANWKQQFAESINPGSEAFSARSFQISFRAEVLAPIAYQNERRPIKRM
jgi:hypothetical protein